MGVDWSRRPLAQSNQQRRSAWRVDTTQQSEKAVAPDHTPRWRITLYAILCICLVLGCASQSQPGPAFASLTISSSTLGKEGNAPSEFAKTLIASLLLMPLLQTPRKGFLETLKPGAWHRAQSSSKECLGWPGGRLPAHIVWPRPFSGGCLLMKFIAIKLICIAIYGKHICVRSNAGLSGLQALFACPLLLLCQRKLVQASSERMQLSCAVRRPSRRSQLAGVTSRRH